jgi:FtsZ-binding cell division protein ZapB
MTTPTRSNAPNDDALPIAATAKLGCVTSIAGTGDLSDDELRDENARLRRQLARLRTANEELSEDNAHLRGSAICWRTLYEAALQSLNGLSPNP